MAAPTLAELRKIGNRVLVEAHALGSVARAGMVGVAPPRTLVAMSRALRQLGPVGGAGAGAALRHTDRPGLVDEQGTLTFGQLDERSNALADTWADQGIGAGTGIGILCRNHRGMLEATFAAATAGARAVYLNTDFAAPQARDVCAREGVEVVVHDEEFTDVVAPVDAPKGRFVAWTDQPAGDGSLEPAVAAGGTGARPAPDRPGSLVLLTSGTTGTPKGAPRPAPRSLALPGAVLSKIPYRGAEATFIAPPMFHAWGILNSLLSIGVGSTLVTRRRFDPEAVLAAVAEHRCSGLAVVPIMLSRLLDLGPDTIGARDLSALRFIAVSGAQLAGALAARATTAFGDVVHNLYGSTEVAYPSIATPEDLRAAPGTAGRPPFGTTVRIVDDRGRPLPQGETGRIFVGNGQGFAGYTGGGTKDVIDGLMSTGDVGHFDPDGRLFVDGRDDEMIVSGGENVFPRELEELLASHDAVGEVAVVGVPDDEFGQRLCAFVVRRPGHELSADDVRGHVRENLARYKVPRQVTFLDELPRNPSGKVLKRELQQRKDET